MSSWFGPQWPSAQTPAPVCEDLSLRVATPVGERCLWCEEEIAGGDRGLVLPCVEMLDGKMVATLRPVHIECQTRMGVGGPAHLLGACTCCAVDNVAAPRSADPDLGMSARQAALWVWGWLHRHGSPA